jgi:hypothetical protein
MSDKRGEPSAAAALWGHLPHDNGRVADWVKSDRQGKETIAQAIYPRPAPPKPNPDRERLLRHLRVLSDKIRGGRS